MLKGIMSRRKNLVLKVADEPDDEMPVEMVPAFIADDPVASAEYLDITAALKASGLWASVDARHVGHYALTYSRWVKWSAAAAKINPDDCGKYVPQSVWMAQKLQDRISEYLADFGMTWASRRKVMGQQIEGMSLVEQVLSKEAAANVTAAAVAWTPPVEAKAATEAG
jgi:hypothetical protein